MFGDPRFAALGVNRVRVVTAWDVGCHPGPDRDTFETLADRRAGGRRAAAGRLLVQLATRASAGSCPPTAPTCAASARSARAIRASATSTPGTRPTTPSQPTFRHPKKAAGFYNAMKRVCPRRCNVAAGRPARLEPPRALAAALPPLPARQAAAVVDAQLPRRQPPALRGGASVTRRMLRITRGRLWITETAGVVVSRRYSKYDEQRAAAATRRMFAFAARSAHHAALRLPVAGRLRSLRLGLGWFRSNGAARPAWRVVVRRAGARARAERGPGRGARPAAEPAALHDTCPASASLAL